MSLLRSTLWGAVARNLGTVYLESTATSGSASTIVDTTALTGQYADDYLNNAWVSIITDAGGAHAAPEGQSRRISDFVGSTGTITVPTVFSASPAAGDTYRVWSGVPKAEILEAVSESLRAAWPSFYQRVYDTTVDIEDDTYEYDIPATIEYLVDVEIQGDEDSTYYVPVKNWTVRKSGASTRKLVLDHNQTFTTDYDLRLIGIGPLDYPANDYTAITIQAEYEDALLQFVAAYGAALIEDRLMHRDAGNDRRHVHRYDTLMARARDAKKRAMPKPDPHVRLNLPEYWS
jgi:hypothetical protein